MAEPGEREIDLERAPSPRPRRLGIRLTALVMAAVVAGMAVRLGSDGSDLDEPEVAARGSGVMPDDDVPGQGLGTSDPSSTTTTSSTTTSSSTSAAPVQPRDGGGSGEAEGSGSAGDGGLLPATTEPPATTTTLPCTVAVNSFEPGCGPFRWTAQPAANQPMTVGIELLTPHPVVGDEIRVRVTASDPDALPGVVPRLDISSSSTPLSASTCSGGHADPIGYGPWDPPSPSAGATEQVLTLSQSRPPAAGEYLLSVCIRSHAWIRPWGGDVTCPGDPARHQFEGDYVCRDPYADLGRPWVRVTIAPAS